MTLTVEKAIGAYVKLREKKAQIEHRAKEEVRPVVETMDKLEAFLKEQADALGVQSFKTESGTAFLTTAERANVASWDDVLKFILENEAYDMLEKRVNKTAVRAYLEANKAVPPGVNYGTSIEVSVRKPTAKD
jgi:hypothetical protein